MNVNPYDEWFLAECEPVYSSRSKVCEKHLQRYNTDTSVGYYSNFALSTTHYCLTSAAQIALEILNLPNAKPLIRIDAMTSLLLISLWTPSIRINVNGVKEILKLRSRSTWASSEAVRLIEILLLHDQMWNACNIEIERKVKQMCLIYNVPLVNSDRESLKMTLKSIFEAYAKSMRQFA